MFLNKFKLFIVRSQYLFVGLTILIIIYLIANHLHDRRAPEYCFPEHVNKYLYMKESSAMNEGSEEAGRLRAALDGANRRLEVHNERALGPRGGATPVLVVAAREPGHLRALLASLALVAGVDDLLLVVSHAHYDARLDRLLRRVDYCMVLQIYPPGAEQPAPAPGNGSCSACDARLAEEKHHWWWTASFVFERLAWPEPHDDMVMFVDAGSYVLPDLLFMLTSAKYAMSYFPDAELIYLGSVGAGGAVAPHDRLTVETWRAAHRSGLAFNRSTWEQVSALGQLFCEYEDTSWSHSLQRVLAQRPGGRALAVAAAAARVQPALSAGAARRACRAAARRHLFPRRVLAAAVYGHTGRVLAAPPALVPAGGWTNADVLRCRQQATRDDLPAAGSPAARRV